MASEDWRSRRRGQRASTGPPRRNPRRGAAALGMWGDYQQLPNGQWMRGNGHIWGTPEPTIMENQGSHHSNNTQPYSNDNQGSHRSNNTQPYSNNGMQTNSMMPGPQPLSRQHSALERFESIQYTPEGDASDLVMEADPDDHVAPLERFYSVQQSGVRFVLYTSDAALMDTFRSGRGFIRNEIQLLYNSWQTVPIDYVLVDASDQSQVDAIRARLPQSVQYIGEGFSNSQMNDAVTTDDHFLLTIEADLPHSTRPVFGMLCCSFEYAEVNSQDYIDATGTPILNFQSVPDDVYLYVHLFTFLSDRASGDEFFTGSHMLEGLYLLFNHADDNTMIYLEAIRVQPTLDFYDRFGMERLPLHPAAGLCFDPFKNVDVPDEVPYVLYDRNQIQVAATLAYQARQQRQALQRQGVHSRIEALVADAASAALLQPLTEADRAFIERSISVYRHTRARADPRPPHYP